ncbi:hypothetical protein [Chryseobacterium binzhouense]|uniref:hypothetical protein n=1 Tax=Chryseobacterium binzhouense TaxID=2593646 RepID=UPI00289FB939|nr:hypothetical protein [Chryseobacterium binzhouense]
MTLNLYFIYRIVETSFCSGILFLRRLEESDGEKDTAKSGIKLLIKKISGKLFEFEILRNKKPENLTTSGFDILIYCYSMNVPNHEASPLQKAILQMNVDCI